MGYTLRSTQHPNELTLDPIHDNVPLSLVELISKRQSEVAAARLIVEGLSATVFATLTADRFKYY